MKRFIITATLVFTFITTHVYAQTTVQGTIDYEGSNTVEVFGKPNTSSISSVFFGNINITFSIVDQGASDPTFASIARASQIPSLDLYPTDSATDVPAAPTPYVIGGRAYYSFLMTANTSTTSTTWTANADNPIATFTFATDPSIPAWGLRLDDVSPTGGPNGQMFWYVQVTGLGDVTNYTTMFYGTGAVNNGGTSPSYVPLNTIVPVKFTGFAATKQNDNALLNWAVSNETFLTDHYEVERSLDGINFTSIASVSVKGGSTNTYNYTDDNISLLKSSGVIYYRIEEFDKNGNISYTEVKAVKVTTGLTIGAYPNPAKNIVSVSIFLDKEATLSLDLSDASGKMIQQMQIQGAKGNNINKLNLDGLATGSYLLKVNSGSEIASLPIVKE
jgi:hypothetical protein